jgi:hypothetical protein
MTSKAPMTATIKAGVVSDAFVGSPAHATNATIKIMITTDIAAITLCRVAFAI